MPRLISAPTSIVATGKPPKRIDEYVGRVSTGDTAVSVARMRSPAGWSEPGQRPQFREITVVLAGRLRVEHEGGVMLVDGGQAVITEPGEWVRYSSPFDGGAEYIAICMEAFSPQTVNRDEEH
ncbi:MAG TPA: AraC family ligand binding domain-containing protein [Candidatus Binatia bacterium]|jgi:mannose-6-phosphate isomerase-like protein (cupin superfamily)